VSKQSIIQSEEVIWGRKGKRSATSHGEDKRRTILKALKVLFEICLCTLTPSSDRMSIVLESGSGRGEFEKVGSSFLSRQLYYMESGRETHILSDD
jgi:hypothetical protein